MTGRWGGLMVLCLSLGLGSTTDARTAAALAKAVQKGAAMTSHASGTFEVKVKPLPNDEKVEGLTVGRMSLDKQFKGELEATSKGTAET